MAVDSLSTGERTFPGYSVYDSKPFYELNPNFSMIGKSILDNKRALDYLYTLDYVDKNNIMVVGHSQGGIEALFLAAFDDRISAIAINCSLNSMVGDHNPYRWSRQSGWIGIPRLRSYLGPVDN